MTNKFEYTEILETIPVLQNMDACKELLQTLFHETQDCNDNHLFREIENKIEDFEAKLVGNPDISFDELHKIHEENGFRYDSQGIQSTKLGILANKELLDPNISFKTVVKIISLSSNARYNNKKADELFFEMGKNPENFTDLGLEELKVVKYKLEINDSIPHQKIYDNLIMRFSQIVFYEIGDLIINNDGNYSIEMNNLKKMIERNKLALLNKIAKLFDYSFGRHRQKTSKSYLTIRKLIEKIITIICQESIKGTDIKELLQIYVITNDYYFIADKIKKRIHELFNSLLNDYEGNKQEIIYITELITKKKVFFGSMDDHTILFEYYKKNFENMSLNYQELCEMYFLLEKFEKRETFSLEREKIKKFMEKVLNEINQRGEKYILENELGLLELNQLLITTPNESYVSEILKSLIRQQSITKL